MRNKISTTVETQNPTEEWFVCNINDKSIKYRKWKVKDRIAVDNTKGNPIKLRQALVYNCLQDKNVILDDYEYQYVLVCIRRASLGNKITYTFSCDECGTVYDFEAELDKIMEPINAVYNNLKYNDIDIEIGSITNRQRYEKDMFSTKNITEQKIIDFAYHIRKINGVHVKDIDSTVARISDLDIDTFNELWEQWSQSHFRLNRVHSVQCPHCNHVDTVEFDTLPNFFPSNWKV